MFLSRIKHITELHCCTVHTPCSLAAITTFETISSSTKGLTASWIITTSGFWSKWLENSFCANTFSPLNIDRWRVIPPSTTVTLLWPYFSMIVFIVSVFSGETTTIMSEIQLILENQYKTRESRHEWLNKSGDTWNKEIHNNKNSRWLNKAPLETPKSMFLCSTP